MRFSWMFAATVLLVLAVGVRCKRKFDGDFEFAEEVSHESRCVVQWLSVYLSSLLVAISLSLSPFHS